MSDAIAMFFLCLISYRAICAAMKWHAFPLVQITINNNPEPPHE